MSPVIIIIVIIVGFMLSALRDFVYATIRETIELNKKEKK